MNLHSACVALALASAVPNPVSAQHVRGWLGGSVGTGRLSIHGTGSSGISGEAAAGVAFRQVVRVGVRTMHLTAVDIAGDQPTWSGGAVLGIVSWVVDSGVVFSTGVGRIHASQSDVGLTGRGTVFETTFEIATPRGVGPGLRLVLGRTWAIGAAHWTDGVAHGVISQLHLGIGAVFR